MWIRDSGCLESNMNLGILRVGFQYGSWIPGGSDPYMVSGFQEGRIPTCIRFFWRVGSLYGVWFSGGSDPYTFLDVNFLSELVCILPTHSLCIKKCFGL